MRIFGNPGSVLKRADWVKAARGSGVGVKEEKEGALISPEFRIGPSLA